MTHRYWFTSEPINNQIWFEEKNIGLQTETYYVYNRFISRCESWAGKGKRLRGSRSQREKTKISKHSRHMSAVNRSSQLAANRWNNEGLSTQSVWRIKTIVEDDRSLDADRLAMHQRIATAVRGLAVAPTSAALTITHLGITQNNKQRIVTPTYHMLNC